MSIRKVVSVAATVFGVGWLVLGVGAVVRSGGSGSVIVIGLVFFLQGLLMLEIGRIGRDS